VSYVLSAVDGTVRWSLGSQRRSQSSNVVNIVNISNNIIDLCLAGSFNGHACELAAHIHVLVVVLQHRRAWHLRLLFFVFFLVISEALPVITIIFLPFLALLDCPPERVAVHCHYVASWDWATSGMMIVVLVELRLAHRVCCIAALDVLPSVKEGQR